MVLSSIKAADSSSTGWQIATCTFTDQFVGVRHGIDNSDRHLHGLASSNRHVDGLNSDDRQVRTLDAGDQNMNDLDGK